MSAHPLEHWRLSQNPPLKPFEAAAKIGVDKATYSRWISGKRNIDPDLLPSISAATGIPAAHLRPDLARIFEVA